MIFHLYNFFIKMFCIGTIFWTIFDHPPPFPTKFLISHWIWSGYGPVHVFKYTVTGTRGFRPDVRVINVVILCILYLTIQVPRVWFFLARSRCLKFIVAFRSPRFQIGDADNNSSAVRRPKKLFRNKNIKLCTFGGPHWGERDSVVLLFKSISKTWYRAKFKDDNFETRLFIFYGSNFERLHKKFTDLNFVDFVTYLKHEGLHISV